MYGQCFGAVRTETKTNGFYIEAGALDGETHSNTLFFELHRNFSGMRCWLETSIYSVNIKNDYKILE